MTITIDTPEASRAGGFKQRRVFVDGRYIGFCTLKSDDVYLQKCGNPECKRENYVMSVSSGQCCWCGWDANKALKESKAEMPK